MNLYEKVANDLRQKIEQGYYRTGDRLPSVRALSQEYGVSITTVQEAYRQLEDDGLTNARPKSGYFVRPPKTTPHLPSPSRPARRPVEVSQWKQVLDLLNSVEDEDMLVLGRGIPNIDSPTLKPLMRNWSETTRHYSPQTLGYGLLQGTAELRHQIARQALDAGCSLHPDDIIVTSGCQEALAISLRSVTQPGDIIAVDSPSFYGVMQIVRALGLKVVEIPTDPENGISLEALELALEQWPIKALQVTPTFNNPLGYTMPDARKQQLLTLAQRFDIAIIEDDIYGDLSFLSPRPRNLKSFDRDGRVLLCSSVSKTLTPGLRIGWVAPGLYTENALHMKYVSTGATTTLPQLAIADFMARGGYDKHVKHMRSHYRTGRDQFLDWVARYFPREARVSYPQGSFMLWIELPDYVDSLLLNERLRPQKIQIGPGFLFSASGKYRNCIRLNYGVTLDERTEKAIQTVGREIHKMISENLAPVA
ncbi:aminotransferase-like domain-containing protein [Mangrovitalea sediminis]|uniref:aminotransferase-like domain-containing protein n=1 Tax=Mangrovitalea sediminis TaxID=1982043 RepID=UPI000BE4DF5B|nr:PLP-dependent aminotransferase family protein [Mangrovitalea sediminis]